MNQYFIQFGSGDSCMVVAKNEEQAQKYVLSLYKGNKSEYSIKQVHLQSKGMRLLNARKSPFIFDHTKPNGDTLFFNF